MLNEFDRENQLRQEREKGLSQGRAEGLQQGLQQGRVEGLEKGKMEIAGNMLKQGYDINMISSVTGLSVEVISALRQ